MTEYRNDPELLAEYLLGDLHAGVGILRRIEQRVSEQQDIEGPEFRTSSVMVTGTRNDTADTSRFSEITFELAVALNQWLGKGIRSYSEASKQLLNYLIRNRITDVDYLVDGKLAEVRERVKSLLNPRPCPEASMTKVLELEQYLRDWLGGACEHDWEYDTEIDGNHRFTCKLCRSFRWEYRGTWLAV